MGTIVVNASPPPEDSADTGPRVTVEDLGSVYRLLEREPPGLLYHYTSLDGLKGVLESGSVWATDIAFLNDAAEVAHANGLTAHAIEHALRKLEASSARNAHFADDDGWEETFYASIREAVVEPRSANVLVTSFSEYGDQLSQWRGYCPPAAGYALGFDGAALRDAFRASGMWFAPCIYDEEEQRLQVARLVETSILYALRWTPRTKLEEEMDIARAIRIFAHEHAPLAAVLKHPRFSEECEWRAFSSPSPSRLSMAYRTGRTMLIPYSVIPLGQDVASMPLREIVIGPTTHPELAAAALKRMLAGRHLSHVAVRNSRSPLRSG